MSWAYIVRRRAGDVILRLGLACEPVLTSNVGTKPSDRRSRLRRQGSNRPYQSPGVYRKLETDCWLAEQAVGSTIAVAQHLWPREL